jgi:hypothetical protein
MQHHRGERVEPIARCVVHVQPTTGVHQGMRSAGTGSIKRVLLSGYYPVHMPERCAGGILDGSCFYPVAKGANKEGAHARAIILSNAWSEDCLPSFDRILNQSAIMQNQIRKGAPFNVHSRKQQVHTLSRWQKQARMELTYLVGNLLLLLPSACVPQVPLELCTSEVIIHCQHLWSELAIIPALSNLPHNVGRTGKARN